MFEAGVLEVEQGSVVVGVLFSEVADENVVEVLGFGEVEEPERLL